MPMGDKYRALTDHLIKCGQDRIEMTFEQVAKMVGGIPPSKYIYAWSNDPGISFHRGWLNAGYIVSTSHREQRAIFIKGKPDKRSDTYQNRNIKATLPVDKAIESIRKFHGTSVEGTHTRFRSWEYCYKAFRENRNNPDKIDYLSLHLAWFLASWGMLRNSFLLNMDYQVHFPVVQVIISGRYNALFAEGHSSNSIPLIMKLADEIRKSYAGQSVSDTLVTKILLGVFGCAPAYDRFFVDAAREYKVCSGLWGERSIKSLWQYYQHHYEAFEGLRHELSADGVLYPPMKLMDMCLWQLGYDSDKSKDVEK